MRLIECYIDSFGKFNSSRHSFSSGLNCITEDNGYGKTTLTVFIKAMLYGLDSSKSKSIEKSDRARYLPWGSKSAGGSLVFEHEGTEYRIERSFGARPADDTFALYFEKSGKPSTDFTERVGEELFGIDVDGFERTVFLSEQNLSGKNENKTVSAKLSDLTGVDGDMTDMDDALKALDDKRRELSKSSKEGGLLQQTERRISALHAEISELEHKKAEIAEYERRFAELGERLDRLDAEDFEASKRRERAREAMHKREFIRQWSDMKAQLSEEERKLGALADFFRSGIPSEEELAEIREAERRIYSIDTFERASSGMSASPQRELEMFFGGGASDEEIEALGECSDKIRNKSAEAAQLKERIAESEFDTGRVMHTAEEYDSAISALTGTDGGKRKSKLILPIILLVFSLAVVGAGLINSIFYAVGAVLLVISVIYTVYQICAGSKGERAALASARALLTCETSDERLLSALYDARAQARAYAERAAELSATKRRLLEAEAEIGELMRRACAVIAKFPIASTVDIHSAAEEILSKKRTYDFCLAAIKDKSAEESARGAERMALAEKISIFASRFGISSSEPCAEIERKLTQYRMQIETVDTLKIKTEEHARAYSITEEGAAELMSESVIPETDSRELIEKIKACRREKIIAERRLEVAVEQYERIYAASEELELLLEEKKRVERDLFTVKKTQEYLKAAKDSLTEKYLSVTQAALGEYISLITDESPEDFKLDASFVVRKSEGAAIKEAEAYSRGLRDLYALAVRLAVIDSLYRKESPFIILDDPFAYFDDKHLKAALKLIASIAKKKQVIYLSCTSARRIQ